MDPGKTLDNDGMTAEVPGFKRSMLPTAPLSVVFVTNNTPLHSLGLENKPSGYKHIPRNYAANFSISLWYSLSVWVKSPDNTSRDWSNVLIWIRHFVFTFKAPVSICFKKAHTVLEIYCSSLVKIEYRWMEVKGEEQSPANQVRFHFQVTRAAILARSSNLYLSQNYLKSNK